MPPRTSPRTSPVAAPKKPNVGIIDISNYQKKGSLEKAQKAGIRGVILKATETAVDPSYGMFVTEARRLGLRIAAYHFNTGRDPVAQADFFLDTLEANGGYQDIIPILDWETNPRVKVGTMTRAQAARFVLRVIERTGRQPMLYSGLNFLSKNIGNPDDSDAGVLAQCQLWLAKYGPPPSSVPLPFTGYQIWQYTDGKDGPTDTVKYPRTTEGFGKIDRDMFDGSDEELDAWWQAMLTIGGAANVAPVGLVAP